MPLTRGKATTKLIRWRGARSSAPSAGASTRRAFAATSTEGDHGLATRAVLDSSELRLRGPFGQEGVPGAELRRGEEAREEGVPGRSVRPAHRPGPDVPRPALDPGAGGGGRPGGPARGDGRLGAQGGGGWHPERLDPPEARDARSARACREARAERAHRDLRGDVPRPWLHLSLDSQVAGEARREVLTVSPDSKLGRVHRPKATSRGDGTAAGSTPHPMAATLA